MRTIALIPARSGSKGIPNKNLRLLGGKPLIEWTIDTALQVEGLDRIVVSAGNEEIAVTAVRAGSEAFVRPEDLNGDETPMIDVVRDAIDHLFLIDDDIIVLLQPTAPFRSVDSIQQCVRAMEAKGTQSCITVIRVPDRYHPDQLIRFGPTRCGFPVNRQQLESRYVRAGTVYVFYVKTVRRYGDIYGEARRWAEISESEALNLDEMSDWHEAERRVQSGENRATQEALTSPVQRQEQAQPEAL